LVLREQRDNIDAVLFTPDSRFAITIGNDNQCVVWDVTSAVRVRSLISPRSHWVWSAAISRDGKLFATGGGDGTVTLWDLGTGERIREWLAHTGSQIRYLAFSPDGRTLASAADDKTARLWNVATAKPLLTQDKHADHMRYVAFLPDGKTVVSASFDNNVLFWETTTGRVRLCLRLPDMKGFEDKALSPDGRILATTRDLLDESRAETVIPGVVACPILGHEVILCDTTTGKTLRKFTTSDRVGGQSIMFSPDGRSLATGLSGGMVRMWDLQMGREAAFFAALKPESSVIVSFSPDGRWLATAGHEKNGESRNGITKLWRVADIVQGRPPYKP
jgi:WD40 repeat protein